MCWRNQPKWAMRMESAEPIKSQSTTSSRRLAAVMCANIIDHSGRSKPGDVGNIDRTANSIDLFKSLIGDYGGAIANVSDRRILALFDSAEAALRFSVQVQKEFRDQAAWSEDSPTQLRIGLNLGEVVIHDDEVLGHCVPAAEMLLDAAEPNMTLVTAAIRRGAREVAGVTVRPFGQLGSKDISEQTEIFVVEASDENGGVPVGVVHEATPPEPFRNPSVAVLALANLSGDPSNDHLCNGIAEDIIDNLSRFRSLMVIARNSAFRFNLNSQSAHDVQRRLGVRYILGGSLRRADRRLRIAVELIDAETAGVLWSDRFSVTIDELFDVQDEIAGAVAARLSVQIDMVEQRQRSYYPRDMRAHGLVLRGQHLILQFNKVSNLHARRLFEEASELAPDYSRAHSSMSRTHNLDWRYSWSAAPLDSLQLALNLARRSTELDRFDARGFAEVGYALLYKRRHLESLAGYAKAIALNPNDSDIIAEYADALVYAGQPAKSVELLEKAMRLNPYYPDWYLWYLAGAYNHLGRPGDVISTVQRMRNPAEGRRLLAANFALLGMMKEASAEAAEVLRLHPGFSVSEWRQRPPYRDDKLLDRYVDALRRAGLPD